MRYLQAFRQLILGAIFLCSVTSQQANALSIVLDSGQCMNLNLGGCFNYSGDCGLFLGGSFLYWTACQNHLDYAVDDTDDFDDVEVIGPGHRHFLDYNNDFGYRVWIGTRWGDCWSLRLVYTHFDIEARDSVDRTDKEGIFLRPTMFHPASSLKIYQDNSNVFHTGRADKANGTNHLNYDVLDALVSKPCCLCDAFLFRPYFGVRYLWLDQKLRVSYEGQDFQPKPNEGRVIFDSEYDGIGLHIGTYYDVDLCNCFGLYFDFGGSLIAGEASNHHKETYWRETLSHERVDIDVKECECSCLPGYNLGLGLTYENTICGCWCFIARIGYEMNHWFNTPRLPRYHGSFDVDAPGGVTGDKVFNPGVYSGANGGNILFHGLTIDGEIHF